MNILEILQQRVKAHPERPAIIDLHRGQERTTTYAELEAASIRVAIELERCGLREGDTALVFYPMSAELYVTLAAIFRLGMVAMFLDPSAGRKHLEQCCARHSPQALIASPKAHLLRFFSAALRSIPHKFTLGKSLPRTTSFHYEHQSEAVFMRPSTNFGEPRKSTAALLTFTSGSTGQPKAAMRTQEFLLAQYRVLHRNLELMDGECDLTTLPVFALANLASGVTSLIPNTDLRFPGKIDPAPIVKQLQEKQPTRTAASPAFLERLADYCLEHKIELSGFRKIFTGGAPVFPGLLEKLQIVAPEAKIVAVYGSTEAEPMAEIARNEISKNDWEAMLTGRGLLAGKPVAEIQMRVVRDDWTPSSASFSADEFEKMQMCTEQPGEIVVSGDHVLVGYWCGMGDDETKFRVDETIWHRTGDAGYLDAAGRLWLLGRCQAKVSDRRGTVFPFAVECAAMQESGIQRAALVPHRHRRLLAIEASGEKIIDLVKLQSRLHWAGLDEIRLLDRIPVDKRHNAKIDYAALREIL